MISIICPLYCYTADCLGRYCYKSTELLAGAASTSMGGGFHMDDRSLTLLAVRYDTIGGIM